MSFLRKGGGDYFWCEKKVQRRNLLSCPTCEKFPCKQLKHDDLRNLENSPLIDKHFLGLERKRTKMMQIAKFKDGSLKEVDLDENNPDPELVGQIEEVYCISKVLVPVFTLKAKPKKARDEVKAATKAQMPQEAEIVSAKGRGRGAK